MIRAGGALRAFQGARNGIHLQLNQNTFSENTLLYSKIKPRQRHCQVHSRSCPSHDDRYKWRCTDKVLIYFSQ